MSLGLFLSRHHTKYIENVTSSCLGLLVSHIPGVLNTNMKTNWRVNTNFWISEMVAMATDILWVTLLLVERVVYQ